MVTFSVFQWGVALCPLLILSSAPGPAPRDIYGACSINSPLFCSSVASLILYPPLFPTTLLHHSLSTLKLLKWVSMPISGDCGPYYLG